MSCDTKSSKSLIAETKGMSFIAFIMLSTLDEGMSKYKVLLIFILHMLSTAYQSQNVSDTILKKLEKRSMKAVVNMKKVKKIIVVGVSAIELCGDIKKDSTGAVVKDTDFRGKIITNNTSDVKWLIEFPAGNKVHVIMNSINVTNIGPKQNYCAARFLLVRSIPCKSNNDVQRFCKNSNTMEWVAPSNKILVSYYLKNSLLRDLGFHMEYYAECGGSYDTIDDLLEPVIPPFATKCIWTFNIPTHQQRPALLLHSNNDDEEKVSVKGNNGSEIYSYRDSDGIWQYPDTDTLTILYTTKQTNRSHSIFRLQYIANDNPCLNATSPCLHGVCVPNGGVKYNCSCSKAYTGKNCSTLLFEGPLCKEERFPINDEIIVWEITKAGNDDVQHCPGEVTGQAIRPCLYKNGQGQWGRPDLSGCINQVILDIAEVANALKAKANVDKNEIVNITSSIVNATSGGVGSAKKQLFPGDLLKTTEIVQTIAEISKNVKVTHMELHEIAQDYGDAVGGMIDRRLSPVWRLIQLSHVESQMASILTSVSTLASNVANKRMDSPSSRRKRELSDFSKNLTIQATNKNLDFSVTFHERVAMCDDKAEFVMGQNVSSSITLSSDVFRNAVKSTRDQYIHIYTARFSSMAHVLTAAQEEEKKHISKNDTKDIAAIINSDIVSGKVLNAPERFFHDFQKDVTIVLKLRNNTLRPSLEEKCVFMNMTASNHQQRWSTKGCKKDTAASNETHIVCLCSHLTNFAVLMDVFDVSAQIDEKNNDVLTYLTYAGCSLSILCCVIAIIVFHYYRLRIERIKIHEHLAVAIILVQLLFLVGIDRTENKYVCMSLAIAIHYALTAMFCWMLVEGFHLYVLLIKVFNRGRHFTKYMLIGWGIPLVVIAISSGIFHEDYGNATRCWLSHKLLLVVFVPTVGLVILINTVILLMVLRIMMRSMSTKANAEERSTVRAGLKAAAILLPLLGLTWTLGFLSVDSKDTLVFTYLFTLCNSLQGVFFFLFHCFFSVDVKKAYKRRSQRRSTITWTNFTGSSKRKSFDQETFYSNSKESINTVTTDASSIERRKIHHGNGVDRIYRDPRVIDRFGFGNGNAYHDNLFRSKSDETSNVFKRKLKTSPILDDLNGLVFYRGNSKPDMTTAEQNISVRELKPRLSSDNAVTEPKRTYEVNITNEDLHEMPIRRELRSSSKTRDAPSTHVRFDDDITTGSKFDDDVFQKTTPDDGQETIKTSTRRPVYQSSSSSASTSSNKQSVSSDEFLRELKEKTASFREK